MLMTNILEMPVLTRKWWMLTVTCLSVIVVSLDLTILNIALPAISAGLHAGTGDLQWLVGAYSLVFAGVMLPAGMVGDRLGRKRLLLAGAGVRFVYWMDVASFGAAASGAFMMSPQPPRGATAHRAGFRSIIEGLRFVRGRQAIQGAYLIDINAMVFGMPRALFPALAIKLFGGGAATLGLLYAAPGAGALIGALTTGWVSRIQRQGLAVIFAVIAWGAAITAFGLVHWLPAALTLLAAAGCADVISAVFRSTIIQLSAPDALRGRLAGLQIAVVTGGPRIGDLEAGAVATGFGRRLVTEPSRSARSPLICRERHPRCLPIDPYA